MVSVDVKHHVYLLTYFTDGQSAKQQNDLNAKSMRLCFVHLYLWDGQRESVCYQRLAGSKAKVQCCFCFFHKVKHWPPQDYPLPCIVTKVYHKTSKYGIYVTRSLVMLLDVTYLIIHYFLRVLFHQSKRISSRSRQFFLSGCRLLL